MKKNYNCIICLTGVFMLLVAFGRAAPETTQPPIRVLILTGQNNHNWRATTPYLRQILEQTGRFRVEVTENPAEYGPEEFAPYHVLLDNYNGPRWGERTEKALLDFVRGGKGFVVIHAANNAFPDWPEYDRLIGGAWRRGAGHGRRHRYKVTIRDLQHPITRNMPNFLHAVDELYHRLTMQPNLHLLASAYSAKETRGTGREEPIAWVVYYGKGRVFHTVLGHDLTAMRGLGFVALVQRGTEWAATGEVSIPLPEGFPVFQPLTKPEPPVRVLVWSEGTAPPSVYPEDINGAIAAYLKTRPGLEVRTARITDPEQGLSEAALAETDVLIWWGHVRHGAVADEAVQRIVRRVREGGMGFIALHSSHWAKPFKALLGTSGNWKGGFRNDGKAERVQIITPSHPIAEGLSDFGIPRTEMYGDPFEVPQPDTVVFQSTFEGGGTARSGCTWTVGKGRVFYFRAGHETYPIYFQAEVRRLLHNAVLWVAGRT